MEKPKFIRRNGRVIPIYKRDSVKGAAIAGAGVGVAGAAGYASSRLVLGAASAENAARTAAKQYKTMKDGFKTLGPMYEAAGHAKLMAKGKEALRHMAMSKALFKSSLGLRHAGFLAGSALVGAGVHKALNDTPLKDNKKTKLAIAGGVATATHFAIRSSFLKGIGHKSFAAVRMAVKDIILGKFGGL